MSEGSSSSGSNSGNKILVVLTSGFPFNDTEPFFFAELAELSSRYEQVVFVPTDYSSNGNDLQLPVNCTSLDFIATYQRPTVITLFPLLAKKDLWKEWIGAVRRYGFRNSFFRMKVALVSYYRASKIVDFLKQHNLCSNEYQYYSFWSDDAAVALGLIKQQYRGSRAVSRAHGWDLYLHIHPHNYLPFPSLILNSLDMVISCSNVGLNYIHENWDSTEFGNVAVSYLGTRSVDQRNSYSSETIRLVSCSYVVPVKRVTRIAEALALLNDIPVEWIHFGDGEERENLIVYCAENLPENVNWKIHGMVSHDEILSFYEREGADLFVNVSYSEGLPVSLTEAFAAGIPAIVTDVGGNTEVVDHLKNGFVLHQNFTNEDLVAYIRRYQQMNREEREAMRQSAQEKWKRFFDERETSKNAARIISGSRT